MVGYQLVNGFCFLREGSSILGCVEYYNGKCIKCVDGLLLEPTNNQCVNLQCVVPEELPC